MRADSVAPISKDAILAARAKLVRSGTDAQHWALDNGYSPNLVRAVLSGQRRCLRGKSREIAQKLALFSPPPSSSDAGKDTSSPAGHTLAGAGAIDDFDRTGILQLVGEPAR
jgi:gp16 family phage-associated protein